MLEIEPGYREVVHCSTYAPYLPYLPSFKLAEVSQVAEWRRGGHHLGARAIAGTPGMPGKDGSDVRKGHAR